MQLHSLLPTHLNLKNWVTREVRRAIKGNERTQNAKKNLKGARLMTKTIYPAIKNMTST
jgi:hypothetical protein